MELSAMRVEQAANLLSDEAVHALNSGGIAPVHPTAVGGLWAQVEAALRAPAARLGQFTMQQLLVMLVDGHAQLWHVFDAWAVTDIQQCPALTVARLILFDGSLTVEQASQWLEVFNGWAMIYGAAELCIVAEASWTRTLRDWDHRSVLTRPVRSASTPTETGALETAHTVH